MPKRKFRRRRNPGAGGRRNPGAGGRRNPGAGGRRNPGAGGRLIFQIVLVIGMVLVFWMLFLADAPPEGARRTQLIIALGACIVALIATTSQHASVHGAAIMLVGGAFGLQAVPVFNPATSNVEATKIFARQQLVRAVSHEGLVGILDKLGPDTWGPFLAAKGSAPGFGDKIERLENLGLASFEGDDYAKAKFTNRGRDILALFADSSEGAQR